MMLEQTTGAEAPSPIAAQLRVSLQGTRRLPRALVPRKDMKRPTRVVTGPQGAGTGADPPRGAHHDQGITHSLAMV